MAKSKKVSQNQQTVLIRAAVVGLALALCILKFGLNESRHTLFGNTLNADYGDTLISILSSLSLLALISLFFNRNKMTWWALGRLACIYLAAFLFLFGWKLAATGIGMQNIHNDGYSVTGGFMMFLSGLYFGYLATVGRLNHGKR